MGKSLQLTDAERYVLAAATGFFASKPMTGPTCPTCKQAREPQPIRAMHVIYGGLNAGVRQHFPNANPVEVIQGLVEKGVLAGKPVRGGYAIWLASDTVGKVAQSNSKSKIDDWAKAGIDILASKVKS